MGCGTEASSDSSSAATTTAVGSTTGSTRPSPSEAHECEAPSRFPDGVSLGRKKRLALGRTKLSMGVKATAPEDTNGFERKSQPQGDKIEGEQIMQNQKMSN